MKRSVKRKLMKLKRKLNKQFSVLLALIIFLEASSPFQLLALTGGPSQPEVQSFQPISTSDMVSVFTGDFNYNIPLLDVEGYPINIAYNSGISTDQEASWVGLGWNINPGVINRNMRGLPDDFSGDVVEKEFNMKPNKTWGGDVNFGVELFGAEDDVISLGLGASVGFKYNNYTGPSIHQGMNVNISAGVGGSGKLNAGLGITSSSDDGLTIQPSVGFSAKVADTDYASTSVGASIGTSFNSRGGLKELTISTYAKTSVKGTLKEKETVKDKNGVERTRHKFNDDNASVGKIGAGGTFDFGSATYTPKVDMSMKNFSMSGSFTLGGELWGVNVQVGVSGFYSAQELASQNVQNPAFGYLYSQNGQRYDQALMDFNREKEGAFTENSASLPLANLTFDTYGVSGQGIGGSYRPFRGDVGHVFDAASYTSNDDDALTAELGFGGYVHVGTNVTVIDVVSSSGKWKSGNPAANSLVSTGKGSGNDFENVYFKEANEKGVDSDDSFYASIGGTDAVRFDADFGKFDHNLRNSLVKSNGQTVSFSGPVKRKKRDKRTQTISFLKKSEYNDFAVEKMPNLCSDAKAHHIAEVTTLGTDGSRYIYGIAAYNTSQKEITFSVGSTQTSTHDYASDLNDAASKGLVSYSGSDRGTGNQKGDDNFYSSTTTPAYAHSYLLTSVLTADYIDADSIRGPSDGDFGNYTKFRYRKISNFKWRTPVESNKATFTESLKSNYQDDKANIIYGEKELWFLDSIITKNYIAVFHKSRRHDGIGVQGVDGGLDLDTAKLVYKLDSISLYSKRDLSVPVKRVHFQYNYELCPDVTNNDGVSQTVNGTDINLNKGKLTLKKIFFTYQNSNLARLSPYVFDYHAGNSAENPSYNIKAYDRWGNYKPNNATTIGVKSDTDVGTFVATDSLAPSDYPYVEQDTSLTNTYCAVWTLKEITLPSGGTIKATYESDDYAYVQNKQAGEMFKITGYESSPDSPDSQIQFNNSSGTKKFYFKMHPGDTDPTPYVKGLYYIYYRVLVNIRDYGSPSRPHLEYVSGYGRYSGCGYDATSGRAWVAFMDEELNDNSGPSVNPVVKSAIQYGRLHMPKVVWDATAGAVSGTLSKDIISSLINSSYIKNVMDAAQGPNVALYNKDVAKYFVAGKSWIRLNNPDGHKLGGGLRVKKIEMIDNWESMAGSGNGTDASYGQEYSYNLEDGRSSGVAIYEPQLGGDENPLRQPVFVNEKKLMVPDDQSYVEEPFGESFYPSASVGYSRVAVKNLQHANLTRHATGSVVHEFYTAKDFPVITERTSIYHRRGKDGPGSIRSLLKIDVRDYMAATQGFKIELNDMHGKPKTQKVYQEGQAVPITSIEYKYKTKPHLNGSFRLRNNCDVVEKTGDVAEKEIGMFVDAVADFRESKTETNSYAIGINVDVIPIMGYPIPIPMIWPSFARNKTRFRSATMTKVVQRFGIMDETVASDLGSVVSTKNLAFDAETGDVLLTQTTTNYNDKIYTMKYPAWWYYTDMGPSYENLGFEMNNVSFSSGVANVGNVSYLFHEGDELALFAGSNIMAWVSEINGNNVTAIKKDGGYVNGTYALKIIRSGKRNNLLTSMATVTSLSNPLTSLKTNAYSNVLQASATEFSNDRKTHCDCIEKNHSLPYTVNPYVNGTKGTWRVTKEHTHLTTRSQANTNNNSNIRKDGVFESYTPFYKLAASSWQKDEKDWTHVSEVTEFNVFGQEVENKDPLNRYSSATFGYNQTAALSVAANTKFKEQAFDGFEDYAYNPCVDDHFKFDSPDTVSTESHTGRYSLKVASGSPKYYNRGIATACAEVPDCPMTLKGDLCEGNKSVAITGGTEPYSVEWEVISGASSGPNLIVDRDCGVYFTASGPYIIEVTITDANGCSKSITISQN
jgi:hypothetical protein